MPRSGTYKKPGDIIVTVPMAPALHKRMRMEAFRTDLSVKDYVTWCIERTLTENGA